MITIDGVSKWYGAFQVLTECTTSIAKGEVVVVCGPSGSGKSTLIKCVNGLEPFQSGEIVVNGTSVGDPRTDLSKLRAHVGMVFQNFELFPHMSITDNLAIAQVKVLGRGREEAVERVAAPGRRDVQPVGRTVTGLNGGLDAAGQHQRVAHRIVALDVGLLGIDQQPAAERPIERLALPAWQVRHIALARQVEPGFIVGKAAQPVALAQQKIAAAQAQAGILGPAGQRHVEIGQRSCPVAARGQQAGACRQGRQQAMVDRQCLIIGLAGFVGPAQRLQRPAAIMGDGGITRLHSAGAIQGIEGGGVVAQHRQAAGEIDLSRS